MTQEPSPGRWMRREMSEQPEVLRRLIGARQHNIDRLRTVLPARPAGVVFVARGSSDQAALYGRYLWETYAGVPVSMAAASVHTRYGSRLALGGWLAVAVSQSGETPEVIEVLDRLGRSGARTVAVSNDPQSHLAQRADVSLDLQAGAETAVPATKTFTASLLAMVQILNAVTELPWSPTHEEHAVAAMAETIDDEAAVQELAEESLTRHPLHIGRSFTYPVAVEAALKFKESTGRASEGYASADLLHGPVAAVDAGALLVGYAARGAVFDDVVHAVDLASRRGASAALVVERGSRLPAHVRPVWVPEGTPEALAPLSMVVRAQQLALASSLASGWDPDRPGGLSKITRTS